MGVVGLCWFFGGEAEGRGVADCGECEGGRACRGEESGALGRDCGGALVIGYGLAIRLLKKLARETNVVQQCAMIVGGGFGCRGLRSSLRVRSAPERRLRIIAGSWDR